MMDPLGVTLDETSTTFARLFGSLIISIISGLLNSFVKGGDQIHFRTYKRQGGGRDKNNYIDLEEKDDSKWE